MNPSRSGYGHMDKPRVTASHPPKLGLGPRCPPPPQQFYKRVVQGLELIIIAIFRSYIPPQENEDRFTKTVYKSVHELCRIVRPNK